MQNKSSNIIFRILVIYIYLSKFLKGSRFINNSRLFKLLAFSPLIVSMNCSKSSKHENHFSLYRDSVYIYIYTYIRWHYIRKNVSNDSRDWTNANVETQNMAVKSAHTECSKYLCTGEWIKDTLRWLDTSLCAQRIHGV